MRAASIEAFEHANAAIEEVCSAFPHVSLERVVTVPPWEPPANAAEGVGLHGTASQAALLGVFAQAGARLGLDVLPEIRGGGSDANWLSVEDYPVLDGLGPSGYNAHCCKPGVGGDSSVQEFAEWETFSLKAALSAEAILIMLEQPTQRSNG